MLTAQPDGNPPDGRLSPNERQRDEKRRGVFKAFQDVGPFLSLGIQLAAAVALMFFLGRWLDRQWGTEPWMMLLGTTLGAGAGFYNFIKTVTDLGKNEKKSDQHHEN